jgi:hypothetical protein
MAVMRRCVLPVGEGLPQVRPIKQPEDVFFLTRAELDQLQTNMQGGVEERRAEWQRQRRLVAPRDWQTAAHPGGVDVRRHTFQS